MNKLIRNTQWYYNRLRCMSIPEIIYRLQQDIIKICERIGINNANVVPQPDINRVGQFWIKNLCVQDFGSYIIAARNIIHGENKIFSLNTVKLNHDINWNCDPLTKIQSPLSYGMSLNYRDDNLVGDIKYLWEPNRHIHLVLLARAYSLTNEAIYLKEIKRQILSWIEQCPYLMGPNWASSLELAIRLINWSIIWQIIGGFRSPIFKDDEGKHFQKLWLIAIYQHSHFIRHHFSRFSSANNHFIGEASGLFVASTLWPLWSESRGWQNTSRKILIQEIIAQNYSDGVNKEQAISYQQFVLDFFLMAALAGRANDIGFPPEYWKRMETMMEFIASMMDLNGNIPMYGDADDGYVVKLSQEDDFCPYRSLLATGSVLFDRPDFKYKAKKFDDKSRILLPNDSESYFNEMVVRHEYIDMPIHKKFSEGGYYILGSNFETLSEVRLIIDIGPLGYQTIAAHGHADALAITLNIYGKELLIDPGTYVYHTNRKWRDYFRGTSAHNTVIVDGENQSVIGGNFMWLNKAQAKCLLWKSDKNIDRIIGQHDGYTRLPDPVFHQREIFLYKTKRLIELTDSFECRRKHNIERYWHFSESCNVIQDGSSIKVNNDNVNIVMINPVDNTSIRMYSGEDLPPLGWISRKFDVKIPTTTVVERANIDGSASIKMQIIY